ncbi:hypothetical protein [Acetobacterium bakii]|uniref:Uncharacterized protein n=1 Tax=Acetobacterium bakii TaxID=52689 RepID=A0A0L6U4L4_9FIRM|nr:hypothetical protein [Acetobacterium bakii]KNZ42745.1 hypothetical protein AKG39_04740 [Acetobacterium bakii]
MDLIGTLSNVGKSTFVKYYYNFKNESRYVCIISFTEDYTDIAKATRTNHAKRIFREGMSVQALQMIINSSRVDKDTIDLARKILETES